MEQGDQFSIKGYEFLACATVTTGGGPSTQNVVVLLGNNSSHFLLAWQETHGDDHAYFICSFEYTGLSEEDTEFLYRETLNAMVAIAKRH